MTPTDVGPLVSIEGRRYPPMPVRSSRPDDHAPPQPEYLGDLAAALRADVEGEVRFDAGSRGAYSTDASNYRQMPIGVVVPRTADDVVRTIAICRRFGAPITSRGGGTSLAGQTCNTAVIIDYSKFLNRVIDVDPGARLARVEPGCVLDDLRAEASRHGLTYGPDPATHDRNTLGGMIGNNSCGVHSVMAQFYGPGPLTRHQVAKLDVVTYGGERFDVGPTPEPELEQIVRNGGPRGRIYRALRGLRDRYADLIRARYPELPRRVSGYNLDALLPESGFDVAQALVGTEGTCVSVLEATVRLIDEFPSRTLVVLGYPDVFQAADHVPEIMAHRPIGLEGIDQTLVHDMKVKGMHRRYLPLLPEGDGWLFVEFGGASEVESVAGARRLMAALAGRHGAPSMRLFTDPDQAEKLWALRESGLGATAYVPGLDQAHPGWEDSAVPPRRSAPTSGSSGRCSRSSTTTPRSTGISARDASTVGSISIWGVGPAWPAISSSSTGRPISWSPMAARSPASTGTASHGRRSSPRCTAPSWWARSGSSRPSGIPTGG